MTDHGRDGNDKPTGRQDNDQDLRHIGNRRDDALDEELRSQLRRKNEESRRNMNDRSGRSEMMDTE